MNSHLYINNSFEDVTHLSSSMGKIVLFSAPMPGSTDFNGDTLAVIELEKEHTLLILADGAGGTPGGNQASGEVLQWIIDFFKKESSKELPHREQILSAIEFANRELLKKQTGAATTLAIVEIEQNRYRTYHIGDSSIFSVGQKGKLKYKTLSHSPHGYAIESGFMDESDPPTPELLSEVSNLVGDPNLRIEMGIDQKMNPHDTLMLCSDGVTDNLSLEVISNTIRKGPLVSSGNDLWKQASKSMLSGKEGSKPDDCSFILYRNSNLYK